MRRYLGLMCRGAMLVVVASAARAETVEEVGKKLEESYTKLKSFTARNKTSQNIEGGQGIAVRSESEGTLDWMRRADKALFRAELKQSNVTTEDGKENKSDVTSLIINDGEFMYVFQEATSGETKGQKSATKMKGPADTNGFKELSQFGSVKVLPDEKVDGQECFVLEVTAKSELGVPPGGRQVSYFRKDIGVNVKAVSFDPDGRQLFTTTVTDVKVGVDIKPERFVFKAPEGVEVVDMSQMQPAAAASEPAAAAAKPEEPAKPAETPKSEEPPKEKSKKPKLPGLPKLPKP